MRAAAFPALFLTLFALLGALALGQQQQVPECTRAGGGRGQCRPLVKCVRFIHEVTELQRRPCSIGNGERGVCCPHVVIGTATCKSASLRTNLLCTPKRQGLPCYIIHALLVGSHFCPP